MASTTTRAPREHAPSHTFDEHVGEVLVRLRADTLPELFIEAGLALAELLAVDPTLAAGGDPEFVTVVAHDVEALLVAWLNELVYRGEINKRIYTELRVDQLDVRCLSATIRGFEPTQIRTAVKAATFHRLCMAHDERGYHAEVVFDV